MKAENRRWLMSMMKTSDSRRRHLRNGRYADTRNTKKNSNLEDLKFYVHPETNKLVQICIKKYRWKRAKKLTMSYSQHAWQKRATGVMLFPVEPEQFLELVRSVVREELDKFSARQIPASFKVSGLTYKPLYKMDEVCELFEITPPTIYEWIKRGKLKPKKIRSRVYLLWNDIQELIQERSK